MHRLRFCIGIVAVSLGLAYARGADWSDSLDLAFDDGHGHSMRYRLFLPPGHDAPDANLPLVLFLHGAGERGNDNTQQVNVHIGGLIDATQSDQFSSFLVAPQVPEGRSWSTAVERDLALQILQAVTDTYSVDSHRLYVTGLSMGGFGTFDYLTHRVDLFAAAVPMSGGGDPSQAASIKDIPISVVPNLVN